jgi:hypothetical protein
MELAASPNVFMYGTRGIAMPSNRKCVTRRPPDHTVLLGGAAILLGISILAGIVFTYGYERGLTARDVLNAGIHVLDRPELPADL